MRKPGIIGSILIILCQYSCAQDTTNVLDYKLGDLSVTVLSSCFKPCDSTITFINIHENEKTSVEAAEQFLKENGGILVQLKHMGERNLTFKHNGQTFSIDPNRMFTDHGRKTSMQLLSTYKKQAATKVKVFADEILAKFITEKQLVVALHNNTDSNYSINSYTNKELEGDNAADVYINEQMDPDDFILTTDTLIFTFLKQQNMNVILQSKNAKDDGSLSIFAGNNNINYVNVEAQHEHLEEQTRMLGVLKKAIEQYRAAFQ